MTVRSEAFRKTVLLVDDEVLVRNTCTRMLTRMGYQVLLAESGEEAVALYREHWQSIALVLLDIIMPHMNGDATLNLIRKVNPDAKVILSSGFPVDDRVESLTSVDTVEFMQKPYSLQQLMDTMHRVAV